VIHLAVMMYIRYPLSLRQVEDLLFERGIDICHGAQRGDGYIRRLLVHGARANLRWFRRRKEGRSTWQEALLARRPTNVVLVAMANKTARVVWVLLSRGETFRIEARTAV